MQRIKCLMTQNTERSQVEDWVWVGGPWIRFARHWVSTSLWGPGWCVDLKSEEELGWKPRVESQRNRMKSGDRRSSKVCITREGVDAKHWGSGKAARWDRRGKRSPSRLWARGPGQPHGRAGGRGIPGAILAGGSAPRCVFTFTRKYCLLLQLLGSAAGGSDSGHAALPTLSWEAWPCSGSGRSPSLSQHLCQPP